MSFKIIRRVSMVGVFWFLAILVQGQSMLLKYVQPLSGTAPSTTLAALKHSEGGSEKNANTIPAVGLPFAMTQWSPQTRLTENKCIPPYFYKDTLLYGFRGTHWLSGSCTQDYGSFTIMPVAGKLKTTPNAYAVSFSHKYEETSPAHYKLTAGHVSTEMTATLRCGIITFTAHQDDSLYVLVMPNSDEVKGFIKMDAAKGEIWGYNPVHRIYQGWGKPAGFSGWFFIKMDRTTERRGTFSEGKIFFKDSIAEQKDIGAFVGFSLRKGEALTLKIGTSFSSLQGAIMNLEKEVGNRGFPEVLSAAQLAWETALSQATVSTVSEKDKRVFYTALYHSVQHPRLFNDVDGTYPAYAGNATLMNSGGRHYYDDFSMWDIYRAQLPLVQLLDTAKTNDFVQSMVWKGQQGRWLPIFPCWNSYTSAMIGDHVSAFIASAYTKGIRGYDTKEAYRLMRQNAFSVAGTEDYINGMGRRALPSYLKYGFIPMEDSVQEAFHKKEQVSRTLEYAFDDYALAMVARGLGKKKDYRQLLKRSFNYEHVFDKEVGLVRGRYANGQWYAPFYADKREPYITEGTPRQYTFYVPHDVPGLASLMGGRHELESALDSLFNMQEYWHGNEPGHQIPFMYNYTASPWKTQRAVRKILEEEYSDGPGGLSGNDDAGQMSAWYVFAAMGLYPLNPVSGEYMLCSPMFDSTTIRLPGGKLLDIVTHKSSPDASFISKVAVNGQPHHKTFISHATIAAGCRLEFWLSNKPTTWGVSLSSAPLGLKRK